MEGAEIKRWRQRLGLTQGAAADLLDIARGTLIDFEKGTRRSDGRPARIPKAIELACEAIERGITEFGKGANYMHRADNRQYVLWASKEIERKTSELEQQARIQFPDDWRPYPYAMIAPKEWDNPDEAQRVMNHAHERGIKSEWRFLPVAREATKKWDLVLRVVTTPTIDDLFFFKLFESPIRKE